MSLVRLLTAGKSLVGLKESANRYQVSGQRLLPRFEAKKNPFSASTRAKREASDERCPPSSPEERGPAVTAVPALKPAELSSACTAPIRGGVTAVAPNFWQGWVGKLKRLRPLRRVAPPKPAASWLNKPLVQPELSLDRVQVVRNDLSDTDVEVVTARAAGQVDSVKGEKIEAAATAGVAKAEKRRSRPGPAKLAGLLLGIGKRQV